MLSWNVYTQSPFKDPKGVWQMDFIWVGQVKAQDAQQAIRAGRRWTKAPVVEVQS